MRIKGIDISAWQGDIDFQAVKNDGITFVIIRAGHGDPDRLFEQNYQRALEAGLDIGTYWYSTSLTIEDAKKEAELFLDTIKGKAFSYPVYVDIESKDQLALGEDFCSELLEVFCSAIMYAGYYPGFYTSKSYALSHISESMRNKYDYWCGEWADECDYPGKYGMWQYTSHGHVAGISCEVDMDYALVDYRKVITGKETQEEEKEPEEVNKVSYQYITSYDSPNYWNGNDPQRIVLHHWGQDGLSFSGIVSWLCQSRAQVSAHYVCEAGRVACIVNEGDSAWHCGNGYWNRHSIGIEARPECRPGDVDTVVELIATIYKHLGRVVPVVGHKDITPTACPGRYYPLIGEIQRRAEALYRGTPVTPPAPSKPAVTDDLYRVQVGAFRNRDNAVKMLSQLSSKQFKGSLAYDSGLYRVQVGAFKSLDNASNLLRDVKGKGFSAIIVYKGKIVQPPEPKPDPKPEPKPDEKEQAELSLLRRILQLIKAWFTLKK